MLEDHDSDDDAPVYSTESLTKIPDTVYRLTNVSPNSEEDYISVTSPEGHLQQSTFDPFEQFGRRVADDVSDSSHDSFVITQ